MKRTLVLGFGLAAVAAVATAQSGGSYVEQWHKAKYGRPSPRAEAKAKAEADSTAYRAEPKKDEKKPSWTEERFKAKTGRNTPAEEARQSEEAASTAYRAEPKDTKQDLKGEELRRREFMKSKYGRDPYAK
ncbi:MAG: hypothetical protein SFV54_16595 [Bryobacteraceae bacterium]|nr:hypothetical protein [Bryobacteraceae bacterium]